MSEPFLAEITIVGFTFPPRGWAFCDGQILPISQNQSLFSLLGTTYGGDGRTSFALPDLRGRAAVHPGANGVNLGTRTGVETVALTDAETPSHSHTVKATSDNATGNSPTGNLHARSTNPLYHSPTNLVHMNAGSLSQAGNGTGHGNMQPFLTLSFCIALQGVFPSRN